MGKLFDQFDCICVLLNVLMINNVKFTTWEEFVISIYVTYTIYHLKSFS